MSFKFGASAENEDEMNLILEGNKVAVAYDIGVVNRLQVMALLTTRLSRNLRSTLALSSRCYAKKEVTLVEPMDLATGKEKAELMAIQAGNDDPFKMQALKRKPNSKSSPIAVPSYFESRMVGCVCEEDSGHINWFWLHMGEPKRCYCGHWFKLEKYNPF